MIDESFNKFVFWRWIIYAVWQGALAVFLCFFCYENIANIEGEITGSVLTDGQFVYTCVVILVNVKILTNAHSFTFFNFFFSIGSIAYFFFEMWAVNMLPFDDLYEEFSSIMKHN